MPSSPSVNEPRELWLVGVGTSHSVAPALHSFIAKELGLPWTYSTKEFDDKEECLENLRSRICSGASVTMPWKSSLLRDLDELDDSARQLAACNTIQSDEYGRLRGSNVDWVGILGALEEYELDKAAADISTTALIIGAGGAARAAVYALWKGFGIIKIYVCNREESEVLELQHDVRTNYASAPEPPNIIHIKTVDQASVIEPITYAVGTIPDFEPATKDERNVERIFKQILGSSTRSGVFVDMCYKPRHTRRLKIAQDADWHTVEGWRVVGHQARSQWIAWTNEYYGARLDMIKDRYWAVLETEAEKNPWINF